MPPHALIFHYFQGGDHPPAQGALTAQALTEFLHRLGPERIMPAAEWLDRAARGRLSETDVCLSFDDGSLSQFDIAFPVLQSLGLSALWFPYTSPLQGSIDLHEVFRHFRVVCTPNVNEFYVAFDKAWAETQHVAKVEAALDGFVPSVYLSQYSFYSDADRKFRFLRDQVLGEAAYFDVMGGMLATHGMTAEAIAEKLWVGREQLKAIHDAGHVIGLHSHQHPMTMAALPRPQQEQDYLTNLTVIEEITGMRPVCAAYPCNSYDRTTLDFMSRQGIRVGFCNTMEPPLGGPPAACSRQDYSQAALSST